MRVIDVSHLRLVNRTLIFFLMLGYVFICSAQFGGGNGTEENPFIINRPVHLNSIRGDFLEANFLQTDHIDLSPDALIDEDWYNQETGWRPLGWSLDDDNQQVVDHFTGVYDGGGYEIRNMTINRPDYNSQALFYIATGAVLRNIRMIDVDLRGRRNGGAIVGNLRSGSLMENCYSSGQLNSPNNQWQHGGLTGDAFNSTIRNSHSSANVTSGGGRCGGIAGWLNSSHVINCFATGNVSAPNSGVAGGLVGLIQRWGDGEGASSIVNSYAIGRVTANNQMGGLVGVAQGAFTISDSYWNTQTTGMNNSPGGGTGRTTDEMTFPYGGEPRTFANWDFEEIWHHDNEHNINNGYPFLDADFDEGEFAGGEGTEDSPWLISNPNHLNNVRNYLGEEHADKFFLQTSEIDLDVAPYNEEDGWVPIGSSLENSFRGTFDGAGHAITGLMIDREESNNQGLFGFSSEATISNMVIIDADVTGQDWAGILTGYSRNDNISGCYTTGSVTGRNRVGGLIGLTFSSTTIEHSFSSADVTGLGWVGGLIGENNGSEVSNCYSRGSVNASLRAGGLVGVNTNEATIAFSYSTGSVTAPNFVGGLVGTNDAEVRNSYWDVQTSNQQLSAGGIGRNTEEMVFPYGDETYTGWDFDDVWSNDVHREINNGYPILHYQFIQIFAGGYGTQEHPWQVVTAEHLASINNFLGQQHSNKYFIQTENIDLGEAPWNVGAGWEPIGNNENRFTANYNGDNYSINNLRIGRDMQYQALFGFTEGAVLTNISLKNVNINADSYTGGLIGRAQETSVTNCFVEGDVTGTQYVGGIAGLLSEDSQVISSYTAGKIIGQSEQTRVGGIAGHKANSSITDSYSAMVVTGNQTQIGGLVGYDESGAIIRSYAVGFVSARDPQEGIGGLAGVAGETEVTGSFWNIYSTGQAESAGGGTGLSTPAMVAQATYEEAGWDFDDVWAITNGQTFPFLAYQEEPALHNMPGPYNLQAEEDEEEGEVALSWNMIGQPQRYNIYRNNERIASVNHPVNDYDDTNPPQNVDLTYYVTALYVEDDDVHETAQSNLAAAFLAPGFAGGDGTEEDPFQIDSASLLNNVRFFLDSHYIQTADIDLGEAPWNQGEGWMPIGSSTDRFTGSFNGNDLTISNLTILREAGNIGLFSYTDGAVLENINLVDVSINSRTQTGALAGVIDNDTVVRNCSSTGDITIDGAHRHIGGLVGWNINSMVTDSYSHVNIQGGERAGGLVGWLNGGHARNSFATGIVNVTTGVSGGLVGLIQTWGTGQGNGTIANCYATGNVTGTTQMGGLVGTITIAGEIITDSYSIGRVNGAGGGLVGQSNQANTVVNSHWDVETSGRETSPGGGTGLLTRQMIYPYDLNEAFVRWDFENIWRQDVDYVHDQNPGVNNGYPYLHFQAVEPWQLDTPEVNIEIRMIDGVKHVFLSWEAVEEAESYRIYSSVNIEEDTWGDPIHITDENHHSQPIGENRRMFFRVIASAHEAP